MDGQDKKKRRRELIKSLLPMGFIILIFIILTAVFWSDIAYFSTSEGRAAFAAWAEGLGFLGWLITLGIQIFQILLAFLPGEPVELMLGAVWGAWLGTLTCLGGIFIGTFIIFLVVRKFGAPLVSRVVGEGDMKKYKFLSSPEKLEITVFILFFIPGTPKDALSYIAPLLPIKAWKYLLIATVARIPSVVTSTILGDSIADGKYLTAIVVFVLTAIISLGGIILGNIFVRRKSTVGTEQNGRE